MTDDYYEDDCLAKCPENGFTPYTVAHEDEILSNALSSLANQGGNSGRFQASREVADLTGSGRQVTVNLTSWYTLGGPTTHFGGNGSGGWRGGKRGRGLDEEEQWMFRLAEESRELDRQLKAGRDERLMLLEGEDKTRGWVWAGEDDGAKEKDEKSEEAAKAEIGDSGNSAGLRPPIGERKRSGLVREIKFDEEDGRGAREDVEMGQTAQELRRRQGPGGRDVIVQTEQEEVKHRSKWNWGLGGWQPGSIRAVYEVGLSYHRPKSTTQMFFASRA